MYWGSVRFFKHLILTIVALLIIIPTIGCISLGLALHHTKAELKKAETSKADVTLSAEEPKKAAVNAKDFPYQGKYEDLYIERDKEDYIKERTKTVYLTFDDGPSAITSEILDILKEEDVKATFFVSFVNNEASKKLYQRIIKEGHTIGVRSADHDYNKIYDSVDSYLKDFAKTSQRIQDATGKRPEIFRFPGGSINAYNSEIYQPLIAEMLRRGYTYYDWNVSSGDAAAKATSKSIYNAVINGVSGKERAIVLMHDSSSKTATAAALPDIIKDLQTEGYHFQRLDTTVRPVCFSYIN